MFVLKGSLRVVVVAAAVAAAVDVAAVVCI